MSFDLSQALQDARALVHADLEDDPLRHTPTHPHVLALAASFHRALGVVLAARAKKDREEDLAVLCGYLRDHMEGWPDLLTGRTDAPFLDREEAQRALDAARHPADDGWWLRFGQDGSLPTPSALLRALRVWGHGAPEEEIARLCAKLGEMDARSLELEHAKLSPEALSDLARLPGLGSLALRSVHLTEPTLAAMRGEQAFPRLRAFALESARFTPPDGLHQLKGAPWLGRLQDLQLSADTRHKVELGELFEGALPALRRLSLGGNACTPEACEALLTRAPLHELHTLRLHTYERGGVRVLSFLERAALPRLRWLTLNDNDLSHLAPLHRLEGLRGLELSSASYKDEDLWPLLEALAGSLEHLDLSWSKLGEGQLAGWRGLARPLALRGLELHSAGLKSEAPMALLGSPNLPRLQRLTLSSCQIGPAGLADLPSLPERARPMSHLNLGGNPLGPEGASHLSRASALHHLGNLMLWGTKLGDEGLQRLWDGPALEGLGALQVHQNGITEAGVLALAQCGRFPNLKRLVLRQNPIGVEGLRHLAHARGLEGLEHLDLSDTHANAQGLKALANSDALPALRTLSLQSDKLSEAALEVFAKKRGLPGLRWILFPHSLTQKAGPRTLAALDRLLRGHGVRVRSTPSLTFDGPW
jgi:Ran GTPase-activating protein (RanGAP) involved in mRNA processing and transport